MDITLELLVRSGKIPVFRNYVAKHPLDDSLRKEKNAENLTYFVLSLIDENGGLNPQIVPYIFSRGGAITNYFTFSNNVQLAGDIIKTLSNLLGSDFDPSERIMATVLLAVPEVAGFIKRHQNHYPSEMKNLVERGYDTLFASNGIETEDLEEYFPAIDQFRGVVNPKEVVSRNLTCFEDFERSLDGCAEGYCPERYAFLYATLDRMIEMTDKEFVSKEAAKIFSGQSLHQHLFERGKIYLLSVEEESTLTKPLEEYTCPKGTDTIDVTLPIQTTADGILIASKFEEWLKSGRYDLVKRFFEPQSDNPLGLFDPETARHGISAAIDYLTENERVDVLGKLFFLPAEYVNPDSPFGKAYQLVKEPIPKCGGGCRFSCRI